MSYLRQYGEVFLVDWLELSQVDHKLDDYVNKVIEIITKLKKQKITQLDLIGHCIGGNLAIAASVILPNAIKTLTLLSTPWDFSHFSVSRNIYQYFCLDQQIEDLSMIPKLHIQILFFLLFPEHFNKKLDKFFTITSPEKKDLYFRIENWLLSGFALPKGTYQQIMDEVINNNIFAKNLWKVDNVIIDPSLITKPIYQIIAGDDRIVPESSILPLHRLLKKSTLFKVAGGHISYLINNNISSLFEKYNE
ncbi:MAG: alpha/beta fold hydrolase [Rickettsia endosymbiont of Bryobia graminum]|nr:alpha/beta fold hydrolase [Rickettsia endosymbiont of Bryobia graminum]